MKRFVVSKQVESSKETCIFSFAIESDLVVVLEVTAYVRPLRWLNRQDFNRPVIQHILIGANYLSQQHFF